MREENKVDIGMVQIHKKLIGDIAASALKDIDGVSLATIEPMSRIFEYFGFKHFPAVVVSIDRDKQVTVELKVNVRFGANIGNIALHIQEVVRAAIERMVDIHLKEIIVNVQGIDREGG